ncbi:TlpA disulfide reductase family protein [Elizabethkingia meningoseptica]|uniref:TlpA disulfide reductase family protein n=1 Tax=Elizabethkingia meningoseptica TaxID=238 RepID=UPI0020113852|nr:TlpA disulfide reductase family protein [Elizabethkingia meningoseptica]MCL1676815.1 AhpC/TSA family protein [Elizabethkingia meningoseptica]MCL1686580.1 AhpC/TSA family protein [Elizabethkingia meningoseptica]
MKNVFFILFPILMLSCKETRKQTQISGNISNLPDGTFYLYERNSGSRIDSATTTNGKFTLLHKWGNKKEPLYIGLDHIDKKGVTRIFSFNTNAKYRGQKWGTNVFLSDSIIIINGKLTYDSFIGFKLPENKKPVTGPTLIAGKQTEAFYNIDGDLFESINSKTIKAIQKKIAAYPYSYHLLYKINENKNNFSAKQVEDFLKSFKGEITHSDTYTKLQTYNNKRQHEINNVLPLLEDSNKLKKEILNKKYKKHLIIFWASWCGPCREEIPLLKKIYTTNGNNIEFISISIDNDHSAWTKALTQEQMDWTQLIVNNGTPEYESLQIHFKLNQAIPYTILVDSNMKILASSTGLSNEEELIKMLEK